MKKKNRYTLVSIKIISYLCNVIERDTPKDCIA
nr:MAG TPA: hypothetical protein [Caudoviricetes sp.]